ESPELDDTEDPTGFRPAPQAEILFVIDNSASMDRHIRTVSANIDQFVTAFSRQNPLEYRLAVMPVHDRRTYGSPEYLKKFGPNDSLGMLVPVKSASDQVIPGKHVINSTDEDLPKLLSNTLKIGTKALDQGGPEFEELFSPVA